MIGAARTIGVVGGGVVGRATARCFMEHAEVRVYDVLKKRATHPLPDVMNCDLVFVCLPSPRREEGLGCDVSIIERFFSELPAEYRSTSLVLRSTVPVGTTRRLREEHRLVNLVHSPEFLTARCAATDAQLPARNIVGGEAVTGVDLAEVYAQRFPGVPVMRMSSDESEAVKLVQNAFFAVKVAFFNEARSLVDSIGGWSGSDCRDASWERVLAAVLADGRIAHAHTKVPGPDGRFGFGGECLPKDLANFVDCLDARGLDGSVGRAALTRNERDRGRRVEGGGGT